MFLLSPLRWALRLPFLVVFGAVVYVGVSLVQVVQASHLHTGALASLAPARAVLVLGAPLEEGQPSPDLLGRLQQGQLLYDAHRAPVLVVSGPESPAGQASVASVAAAWLTRQGVPAADVDRVPPGDAVTALEATEELFGRGARVIVVTDAVDALWTKGAALAAGLDPVISPALGSEHPVYDEVGPLLSQASGVAAGRVIGYGRASWAAG